MEYEYLKEKPDPQPSNSNELRRVALERIEEALKAVTRYREASRLERKLLLETEDEKIMAMASMLLRESLFVGAAGEVCDACGGSGRKQ